MEITCINCPVGCRLSVTLENGQVTSVTGNTCKRGEIYARQECVEADRRVHEGPLRRGDRRARQGGQRRAGERVRHGR